MINTKDRNMTDLTLVEDDDVDAITLTPAFELYAPLHQVFTELNEQLFYRQLPDDCMISLEKKGRSRGYFSADRYRSTNGNGYTVHLIALNPETFLSRDPIQVFSTLGHEM